MSRVHSLHPAPARFVVQLDPDEDVEGRRSVSAPRTRRGESHRHPHEAQSLDANDGPPR